MIARSRPDKAAAASPAWWYLEPQWFVLAEAERLTICRDPAAGGTVELAGAWVGELLDADAAALARLERLARHSPDLDRFRRALADGAPAPLDRARLLRGPGYHQLFVELTARCNEACRHCYADAGPHRSAALDAATVDAVLDDAAALGFQLVQFTGGDPLLSPVLLHGVERARELGLRVEIYTNGLALTGRLYQRLRAQNVSFAFSFYSHNPVVHDRVTRTPGSQARTLGAIKRVLADGLRFRIGLIATADNADDVRQTRALLTGIGVPEDAIRISYERAVGRGSELEPPAMADGAAEPQDDAGHGDEQRPRFGGKAAVSYDGAVYPCIFGRSLHLGNVYERRLRAILDEAVPLAPVLPRAAPEALRAELSCVDCQFRAALMGHQACGCDADEQRTPQTERTP